MALAKVFIESLKKIPGATFYDVGKKYPNKIALVFRYTNPEGNRVSITKAFDPTKVTQKEVLDELEPVKKEFQSKLQTRGGNVGAIRENYTKAKIGFTDDLINWLETNASDPKYKSPEQLLKAAEKAFNQPKYRDVPERVEKSKAFFNKQRGFLLPRQYQFYGKDITTKNPKKPLTDMAMVALLKSDNPQFVGKKDILMKFYNRDPKSPKPQLTKEENKFLNTFSKKYIKGGAGGAGLKGGEETGSVIFRFLKNEGANFENKLNEWNEIRRLETDIKKELELGGLTQNRVNFLTKTLRATQDKRRNVSEKLRKEYPDLLSGRSGDVSGALVQEHKIARAIGEKSASYVPSTYLAKAEFTPAAFNLQKLKDFDTPLMKYIDQYNEAKPSERPEIIKQIKALKKDFNLKTGGYLDDVDIQFGTKTVKLKDKTPFIFEISPEQTYSQILKNINHSNKYFKATGQEDRIISGDTFNAFQKDLKTRIANQKGENLKSTLVGLGIGVPVASETLDVLEDNPLQAAEPQQAVESGDVEFGDPETWDKKVLDFVKEYPVVSGTAAGTTAVGGALTTKTGRKALGKIAQAGLSTPAGMVGLNLALGIDPTSTMDRTLLEAELAAAPGLVKGAEAVTKNPLMRKLLTLGISPRVAAGLSGLGITALAGEGLYELGKRGVAEYEKLQAMTPEEKEAYLAEEVYPLMDEGAMVDISREGFADGSKPPKMDRRLFLKIMGGIMSLPILGKIGKVAKPLINEIKTTNLPGKPEWFDTLVNKVIREGTDMTKQFATKEREIVHATKIDEDNYVRVYQDLDKGEIRVEYEGPDTMMEAPVDLIYTKGMADETGKVPDSFMTQEEGIVGRAQGPDDFEFEAEGISGNSVEDLTSDISKLKEYATGKKPTIKEFIDIKKKRDEVRLLNEGDREATSDYVIRRQGDYDGDYYED